ncbi:Tryptophan synthase beta subunit-like PLP-dependent enzymes superfamily [Pseudocohnilembus persalinus]|uniref:threonine ammonia-lyase n=1 Tax=Pseudocohnilembus persalinus TaxID=266149 RepID=A0A0V0R4N9_PSEPJ|nr:Tryptophan synthase beta subunit-like PLP-dependent enzymes superfamily [Pseudocohnilembus persalinus]|eukprot:KRX09453.1 Tryptophan synthase beta subunit-like PLP-dependent enzymes superfamily [Pseudocohnilembus persalinus]
MSTIPSIARIINVQKHISSNPLITNTRLEKSRKLSEKYGANIYLKREDMQQTRSFKIRGAVNSYNSLTKEQKQQGVVVASDGNFAQACAFCAAYFKIKTHIFVTKTMQNQRIQMIKEYGKDQIEVFQEGDNFEQALKKAQVYSEQKKLKLIHPFDNPATVEGNGTIAYEIIQDIDGDIDYVMLPVGGGSLAAGMSITFKELSEDTKIIGVEPEGADSMSQSFQQGKVIEIEHPSRFCDGSSVSKVSESNYKVCKENLCEIQVAKEGEIAYAILELYDNGLIVEPSGALSVSILERNREKIKGKNVVCLISGGNTDLSRLDVFREMALMHEGLKYFFLINFPLRKGILREFVKNCLQETDEISHIQFNKRNDRERAPSLIAIEVKKQNDIEQVKQKMKKMNLDYQIVNDNKELYDLLI